MLYKLIDGGLEQVEAERWTEAQIVVVSNEFAERKKAEQKEWHETTDEFWHDMLENKEIRFESHIDFDLICVPCFAVETEKPMEYPLYMLMDKKQLIILTYEREKFEEYLTGIYKQGRGLDIGHIVYYILESLVGHEEKRVEDMEQEVDEWEDREDIDFDSDDHIQEIVRFRKNLLQMKHFYEHLKRTIEYIADNENELFDERVVKRLTILENRSYSMVEDMQVLREEVMQLKEGYQAQRDLNMNKTMQFLTVVTTIFTPLTLLAGWYGMNFAMPEYEHPAAYPILIGLSLLLIIGGIWICKKKKWF